LVDSVGELHGVNPEAAIEEIRQLLIDAMSDLEQTNEGGALHDALQVFNRSIEASRNHLVQGRATINGEVFMGYPLATCRMNKSAGMHTEFFECIPQVVSPKLWEWARNVGQLDLIYEDMTGMRQLHGRFFEMRFGGDGFESAGFGVEHGEIVMFRAGRAKP
jgi:hypothetical protein